MASAPPPEGDAEALDAGEEPELAEQGSDWSSDEEDLDSPESHVAFCLWSYVRSGNFDNFI